MAKKTFKIVLRWKKKLVLRHVDRLRFSKQVLVLEKVHLKRSKKSQNKLTQYMILKIHLAKKTIKIPLTNFILSISFFQFEKFEHISYYLEIICVFFKYC